MIGVTDFYAALVESSDDAIIAKDTNGVVLSWNPAAQRLFGWTSEDMVGNSIRRLVPDDRQHEEDDILARIAEGERVGQFMTKRLHQSGELLDISVTVSPVRDEWGTVVGASKIARNAGPYLQQQAQLLQAMARFETLAETMAQLAWMANPDGHIFWYNKRWYEFTGTTLAEMEGWGWASVQHPDHLDRQGTAVSLEFVEQTRIVRIDPQAPLIGERCIQHPDARQRGQRRITIIRLEGNRCGIGRCSPGIHATLKGSVIDRCNALESLACA